MNRNKLEWKHYTSHYERKYSMISVGIDVSKGKSTVCLMKPGGEVLKRPFEVSHSKQDISALADLIKSYGEEAPLVVVKDTFVWFSFFRLHLAFFINKLSCFLWF